MNMADADDYVLVPKIEKQEEVGEDDSIIYVMDKTLKNSLDCMHKNEQLFLPSHPMREYCIEWILFTADKLPTLEKKSLHSTVAYVDMYLSKKTFSDEEELIRISMACLMLAFSYDDFENKFPGNQRFLEITTDSYVSPKELEDMAWNVMHTIDNRLSVPTVAGFLNKYLEGAKFGTTDSVFSVLVDMADYISEMSMSSYKMLGFRPSMVAAASIFLARYILFPLKKTWSGTMEFNTKYSAADLRDCVIMLHASLIYRSSCCKFTIAKYSNGRYRSVALKTIPDPLPIEIFDN